MASRIAESFWIKIAYLVLVLDLALGKRVELRVVRYLLSQTGRCVLKGGFLECVSFFYWWDELGVVEYSYREFKGRRKMTE